jgi:hypothetical protein
MPRKRAWSKLPICEVSVRILLSQQLVSYDEDETQDMQDGLYRTTLLIVPNLVLTIEQTVVCITFAQVRVRIHREP